MPNRSVGSFEVQKAFLQRMKYEINWISTVNPFNVNEKLKRLLSNQRTVTALTIIYKKIRMTGLEPARRKTIEPKSIASANSATSVNTKEF